MFNIIIRCCLLLYALTLCASPLLIHFGIGLGQTNLCSGESKDEGPLLLPILPSSSGRFWEIFINSQGLPHLLTSSHLRGTCRNREAFPKLLVQFHRKAGIYITLKHPWQDNDDNKRKPWVLTLWWSLGSAHYKEWSINPLNNILRSILFPSLYK